MEKFGGKERKGGLDSYLKRKKFRRKHSIRRRPPPYIIFAIRRWVPFIWLRTWRTSLFVITTGGRRRFLAFTGAMVSSIGLSKTCLYKKMSAFSACRWVAAATLRLVARWLKKDSISDLPISMGCFWLPWNLIKRIIYSQYVCSVWHQKKKQKNYTIDLIW